MALLFTFNFYETVFKVFINKNTVDKESNDCIGSSFNGSASTFVGPTAPSKDSTASSDKDNSGSTGYNPSECSRDRNHDGPGDMLSQFTRRRAIYYTSI